MVNKIILFVVFYSAPFLFAGKIGDDILDLKKLQEKLLTSKGDPRLLFGLRKSLTTFLNDSGLDRNRRFLFRMVIDEMDNRDLKTKKNSKVLDEEFEFINKILEDNNKVFFNESKIIESYNKIISIIGRETFSDIILTSIILEEKILRMPNNDFDEEITREINRFENSKWKDSPFLYILYYKRCLNSKFKKKYRLLICDSKILKSKYELIFGENDLAYFSQLSFLITGLSGESRHIECLDLFKTAPKNWLNSEDVPLQGPRCRIYEAVANSYWKTGKKQTALAYQEMAATIALSRFSDTEYFIVKEQANILRDMYFQMGDWKSLRNLEVRFKLKPLPQNPAEK